MRYLTPQTIHPRIEYLGRQEMNVYLLKGEEYMIIEGGMGYIVSDMLRQFQERGINLNRITRLLILHSHFDHCGIVPFFKRRLPGLKIIGSRRSQELYRKEKVIQFIRDRNREMIQFLKMEKEAAELNLDFDQLAVEEAVGEGDTIDLGEGVEVRVIEMPGHSSCSIAAYVPSLRALFPSDAGGIPGEGKEIFPSGNEDFMLYQKSLEELQPLYVDVVCLARNGAFLGQDAKEYVSRSVEEAEKMRLEIIRQLQGVPDPDEELARLARERYDSLKTRGIPWDVYLGLMRGVVKKILESEKKSQ
ncbi:MAG TPA: MBL fold metallo-hydrolase [Thermodesulfobacteriota bacterium]|nr:MBL fold metallo-hydrolase [Thermodesulfobacteriota bacterium]